MSFRTRLRARARLLQGLTVIGLASVGVYGLAGLWWALICAASLLFIDLLT